MRSDQFRDVIRLRDVGGKSQRCATGFLSQAFNGSRDLRGIVAVDDDRGTFAQSAEAVVMNAPTNVALASRRSSLFMGSPFM
jgi:hypothetical protein